MNPDQTAPIGSLIWVHIVCNKGHLSAFADDKADKTFAMNGWKRFNSEQ